MIIYILVQIYTGTASVNAFKTAEACINAQTKLPGLTKCLKVEVRSK